MKKGEPKTEPARNLNRRDLIGLLSATAAVSFVGVASKQFASDPLPNSPGQVANAIVPDCVVRPQQTEGPYFVDERLNRSDIRLDPSNGKVSEGVPLRLVLSARRIAGSSCVPLSGAMVDLWQCDALGNYSDFQDFGGNFDTRGKKFLRGYQVSDRKGKVEFTTIYPGWYPGRTVHIHFKIRTDASGRGHEFTSQLYFDDALTDEVHALPPYATKGQRRQKNERDGIYRRGGNELMLRVIKDGPGYAASFDIGLQMA